MDWGDFALRFVRALGALAAALAGIAALLTDGAFQKRQHPRRGWWAEFPLARYRVTAWGGTLLAVILIAPAVQFVGDWIKDNNDKKTLEKVQNDLRGAVQESGTKIVDQTRGVSEQAGQLLTDIRGVSNDITTNVNQQKEELAMVGKTLASQLPVEHISLRWQLLPSRVTEVANVIRADFGPLPGLVFYNKTSAGTGFVVGSKRFLTSDPGITKSIPELLLTIVGDLVIGSDVLRAMPLNMDTIQQLRLSPTNPLSPFNNLVEVELTPKGINADFFYERDITFRPVVGFTGSPFEVQNIDLASFRKSSERIGPDQRDIPKKIFISVIGSQWGASSGECNPPTPCKIALPLVRQNTSGSAKQTADSKKRP